MIKKDRIYVEDLRVKGTIGIFDWEKKIKQEISLSYEIDHDNLSASKEDKIEATIAKSFPVSSTFKPPVIFRKISFEPK